MSAQATPTHVVLRPFVGPGGRVLERGEKVAAADWRHARALEEQRHIRPIGPQDLAPRKGKEA